MKVRIVKKEYLNEELLVPFYKYLNEKEIYSRTSGWNLK